MKIQAVSIMVLAVSWLGTQAAEGDAPGLRPESVRASFELFPAVGQAEVDANLESNVDAVSYSCGSDCGCGSGGGQSCGGCCGSCDCCYPDCAAYGLIDGWLCNCPVIKSSDRCFSEFISPMTNPVLFEDPRTVTEIRPIYIHQQIPGGALGGGSVDVFAVPIRVALSERWSLIAPKDGYIVDHSNGAVDTLLDDGWVDVSLGLKYNLVRDCCNRRLLSVGLTYELPVGSPDALQGNGDGVFHPFLSYGAEYDQWHWLSGSGFVLPANTTDESQFWYWSNHLDRKVFQCGCMSVYALAEANWFHYMKSGQDGPVPGIEGGDLINLGSPGVAGNDIVTGAFGLKVKPYHNAMELGIAWETHLTDRRDLLEDRLTVDWIMRF